MGLLTTLVAGCLSVIHVSVVSMAVLRSYLYSASIYFDLVAERPTLRKWVDHRGREGVEEYWQENNIERLDRKDTGILKNT